MVPSERVCRRRADRAEAGGSRDFLRRMMRHLWKLILTMCTIVAKPYGIFHRCKSALSRQPIVYAHHPNQPRQSPRSRSCTRAAIFTEPCANCFGPEVETQRHPVLALQQIKGYQSKAWLGAGVSKLYFTNGDLDLL
jgi:hypothetical protein